MNGVIVTLLILSKIATSWVQDTKPHLRYKISSSVTDDIKERAKELINHYYIKKRNADEIKPIM